MRINEQYTVSEAKDMANSMLTYMDITELLAFLEVDEGELLTTLILEGTIDVSSFYGFFIGSN